MIVKQPESWNETKGQLNEILEEAFSESRFEPKIKLRELEHKDGYINGQLVLPISGSVFDNTGIHFLGNFSTTNSVYLSSNCSTEFWDDVEGTAKNMVEDFLRRFKQELSYAHDDVCDGYSQLQEIDSTIGLKGHKDE